MSKLLNNTEAVLMSIYEASETMDNELNCDGTCTCSATSHVQKIRKIET